MIDALHHLGTAAVIIAAVFAWLFVVLYARDPWRQYEAGRHLMVFTAGHALLLTYIVYRNAALGFVGAPIVDAGNEILRFVAFVFLMVMFIWRYRILRRGQLPPLSSVDP